MHLKTVNDRIFIALDFPDRTSALEQVDALGEAATSYKIGLQLFCNAGPGIVREIAERGKNVFLDLKFHDIPNTVANAVKSVATLGAAMINVHCSGGSTMMQAAHNAAAECGGPAILGVTVLTSLGENDLRELGSAHTPEGQVLQLARMAKVAKLDGVVCSAKEIEILRNEVGEDFLLVTPGIRPQWAAKGDQKRIMTPSAALTAGASALVIGRPVTAAKSPLDAYNKIIEECADV